MGADVARIFSAISHRRPVPKRTPRENDEDSDTQSPGEMRIALRELKHGGSLPEQTGHASECKPGSPDMVASRALTNKTGARRTGSSVGWASLRTRGDHDPMEVPD